MTEAPLLTSVDPYYHQYLVLCSVLMRLGVLKYKKHRTSISGALAGYRPFTPQPHWIPLAIVSLAIEYLEFVPVSQRDED